MPQNASDTKTEVIRKVFDTNFFGTINVIQTFSELLKKTDRPVIVNLSSTDFNNHMGTGSVENAAAFVVKYALLNADGPTGKFFSNEIKEHGNESPW